MEWPFYTGFIVQERQIQTQKLIIAQILKLKMFKISYKKMKTNKDTFSVEESIDSSSDEKKSPKVQEMI